MAIEYRKQRDYPFRFGEELTWQVGVVRAMTWSRRLRRALVVASPQTTRYLEIAARGLPERIEEACEAVVRLVALAEFYEVPERIEVQGSRLHEALGERRELEEVELVGLDHVLAVHRGRRIFEAHCLGRRSLQVERLAA